MKKILFLCHGNICRSPMARFIFEKLVTEAGLEKEFLIDSMAATDEEIGNPIYPAAARELRRRGVKMGEHRAAQITMADYRKFDLIVVMDDENVRDLMRMTGNDPEKKVRRLMDYTDRPGEVSDPWYTGKFALVYDDIFEGCSALLEAITGGRVLNV